MEPEDFPLTPTPKPYSDWIEGYSPAESYYYAQDGFEYFIQNLEKEKHPNFRHLVIRTEEEELVVLNRYFMDSEGSYLEPLNDVNESYSDTYTQWTGKLFKNNPPVVFGLLGHSFGCPSIYFLEEGMEPVGILCDNRH